MPEYIPPGEEHNYIRRRINGKDFWVRRSKAYPWSRAQGAQRDKMTRAANYANEVMADPERYAVYAAVAKRRKAWRVYPLITKDYMKPPRVSGVKLREPFAERPIIRVDATDDFEVVGVDVVVRDAHGAEIARGAAENRPLGWEFRLPRPLGREEEIEAEATARDRPGNATTRVERLSGARTAALEAAEKAALPGIEARRAARKAKRP